MPAEYGHIGNKIKKLCVWAILAADCMIIGYVESLFELSFIAPGIKLGLANCVCCVCVFLGYKKCAFAINIIRILLSALLFGSPVSLVFALSGGIISLFVVAVASKSSRLSVIGVSGLGGAVHNAVQCAVGLIFVGKGVLFYLPVLLVAGFGCGAVTGFLSFLVLKRIKKSERNV